MRTARTIRFRHALTGCAVTLVTATVLAQSWGGPPLVALDFLQLRQVDRAMSLYVLDHDGLYPQAYGRDSNGATRSAMYHYTPQDWPDGPGGDGSYSTRIVISKSFWANTVKPYSPGWNSFRSPGIPIVSAGAASAAHLAAGKSKAATAYTMNGLLTMYPEAAVASPSQVGAFWHGRGQANLDGANLSNPALSCLEANVECRYVPSAAGCSASKNGQTSTMFALSASVWVYYHRASWVAVDGHYEHRALGAVIGGDTDPTVDPYDQYDGQGYPGAYWHDGCHPLLFRPDK